MFNDNYRNIKNALRRAIAQRDGPEILRVLDLAERDINGRRIVVDAQLQYSVPAPAESEMFSPILSRIGLGEHPSCEGHVDVGALKISEEHFYSGPKFEPLEAQF